MKIVSASFRALVAGLVFLAALAGCAPARNSETLLSSRAASSTPGKTGPYLLAYSVNGQDATPSYIKNNLTTLETLPFDGVGITGTSGWVIMDPGQSVSYETWMAELAPLRGLAFTHLKHNLVTTWVNRPADFFDDWTMTIQNFANLARALHDSGIEGILFDDEGYKIEPFNYPNDKALETTYGITNSAKYGDTNYKNCVGSTNVHCKSLEQYYAQASVRGQQIMEAMVQQFPAIRILFFHGPTTSFSGAPLSVVQNDIAWANDLAGAFFVGFVQGSGSLSKVIDGGELSYDTLAQYQASYTYRKTTFALDSTNVPFIPASLRPLWSQKVGVDFWVYNKAGPNFSFLSAATLQSVMTSALQLADDYVWFYTEEMNALSSSDPQWMGDAYLAAIRAARAAVPLSDGTTLPPTPLPTAISSPTPKPAPAADTTKPTVSIITPTTGSKIPRTGSVLVQVSTSDNVAVKSVSLYVDGALKSTSTTAPFTTSFKTRNLSRGSHELQCKAYDAAGNVGTSLKVTVSR